MFDRDGATFDPTEFAQSLHKRGDPRSCCGRRGSAKETRQPACLLRARCCWPRGCAAKRDSEFSPPDTDCHATLPWGSSLQRGRYHALIAWSSVSPLTLQYSPWNADIPFRQVGATSRHWPRLKKAKSSRGGSVSRLDEQANQTNTFRGVFVFVRLVRLSGPRRTYPNNVRLCSCSPEMFAALATMGSTDSRGLNRSNRRHYT
jgi:hypothetical protein